MKIHPLYMMLAAVPGITMAQYVPPVVSNSANIAVAGMQEVVQSYMTGINKPNVNRQEAEQVLRNQVRKQVEKTRQVALYPDAAQNFDQFSLPSLQITMNAYMQGQKQPLPADLEHISDNAGKALQQIMTIEQSRETRIAHMPSYMTDNAQLASEEERQLTALKSQYQQYMSEMESLRADKYGVSVQSFDTLIAPILDAAVRRVRSEVPVEAQAEALNQMFDEILRKW